MVKNQKGLSLVELLAVIAIISILFIFLAPQISSSFEKSRIAGVKNDLNSYRTSGSVYFMKSESEEKEEASFNEFLDKNLRFTNGVSTEKNPWGNPYSLTISADKKKITIKTFDDKNEPTEYSLSIFTDHNGNVAFESSDSDSSTAPSPSKQVCNENETAEAFFGVEEVEGGVAIISYSDDGPKDVVIPCQIGGKDVVDIKDTESFGGAFNGKSLTSVIFPNTLKSISGNYSFAMNALTTIAIPDSVSTIGEYAFWNNAITDIKLPQSLTAIERNTFQGNKIKSLVIPENVVRIEGGAFYQNNITDLTIPDSVTTINYSSFSFNRLENVTIGKGLNNLEAGSFYGNTTAKFYIDNGNTAYKTDENNAGIYTKDGTTIMFGTQDAVTTNTYQSITQILDEAFRYNDLTSATIPPNVTTIGSQAFSSNKLTTLLIPSKVTSIGYSAFYNNFFLETVTNKSSISNSDLKEYFNNYNFKFIY